MMMMFLDVCVLCTRLRLQKFTRDQNRAVVEGLGGLFLHSRTARKSPLGIAALLSTRQNTIAAEII